jgi:hypothetical protein
MAPRIARSWSFLAPARLREGHTESDLSSLRDGPVFNPNPAINCWATFTGSLPPPPSGLWRTGRDDSLDARPTFSNQALS